MPAVLHAALTASSLGAGTSLGLDLHLDLRPNCGLGCSHDAWEYVGNYSAHVFGDRALSILSEHQKEVPLFLYMAFQSVHFPIE